uniref:Uncharacterized protein n=1 Tax=Caenorhabditis japonica TaxID=281687 RepID=A0A8R1DN42_CAEJA
MTAPMMLGVGFTIERVVAITMAQSYEHVRTFLGPMLVFVLVLLNATINYMNHRNETFEDVFISYILIPATSSQEWNNFFWFLLYVDIGNFISICVILITHTWWKKKHLRQNSSLSVKYEMNEIYTSSKFTFIISFSHMLFFGYYLSSALFVRTMGPTFFNGYLNFMVARGIFCIVPTYNLIIACVASMSLRVLSSKRHTKVQTTVRIKATGSEGAQNYDDVISKHWNTVSNRVNRD